MSLYNASRDCTYIIYNEMRFNRSWTSSRLNLALASMLQEKPFMIKHGLGEQKQPFKKSGNSRGREAPKIPPGKEIPRGWGGGSRGKKPFLWGVWLFSGTTHYAGEVHQNRTICCNRTFLTRNLFHKKLVNM